MTISRISLILSALTITMVSLPSRAISAESREGAAELAPVEQRIAVLEDRLDLLNLISTYAWVIDSGCTMEQIASVFAPDAVATYKTVDNDSLMHFDVHLVGIQKIQAWLHEGLGFKAGADAPDPSHFMTNAIVEVNGNKATLRFELAGTKGYVAAYWVDAVKVHGKWRFQSLLHKARVHDLDYFVKDKNFKERVQDYIDPQEKAP